MYKFWVFAHYKVDNLTDTISVAFFDFFRTFIENLELIHASRNLLILSEYRS